MKKLYRYSVLLLLTFCPFALSAQTLTPLFNFDGTDGTEMLGTLAQGIDGALYGTTVSGGANHDGVAFKLTTDGTFTLLHNFCSQGNVCSDGAEPRSGMVLGTDGNLYGTTTEGGNDENGTIYKVTRNGRLTSFYRFDYLDDGACPEDALIEATDGALYGTTNCGGDNGNGIGTVFRITPTGILSTLHYFDGNDGQQPIAGLVQTGDGGLLGTTSRGGTGNCNGGCGTAFRITPRGIFATLHNFNADDGEQPQQPLTQASDGNIYGTTFTGAQGYGTIFKISLKGKFSTIHMFGDSDGANPSGKLIEATDGNLYGTTFEGGIRDNGLIFQITPNGVVRTVYSFHGIEGSGPNGLVQHTNGKFYGAVAGAGGLGSIYELDMGLSPFVTFARASGRIGQSGAILGQGFKGTTDVSLNGVSIDFIVASDTHIIATIPADATSGYVTVTTPSGVLTSNVPFRVLP